MPSISQNTRRPSRKSAEVAINEFLAQEFGQDAPSVHMIEDGSEDDGSKCGWAFWVLTEDTTSYVHNDLKIEWYGTSFERAVA